MEENQQTRNQNHEQTQKWDTKDELLLAFAVKRHGLKNWDSVSMELHSKTSLPPSLTTASLCRQKYLDLHRRFSSSDTDGDNIPWLEELRKLRVSELKQEVQKYDLSILSLQLKVKRLEEEREKSLKEKETNNDNDNNNIDNDQTQEQERPENDNKLPRGQVKEIEDRLNSTHESLDSDRENGSVNESNSTGIEGKTAGAKEVTAVEKTATVEEEQEEESGEVESSARRKKKGGGGGESEVRNEAEKKSEPLIGFDLDSIRAHKFGSFFEGRLPSQETAAYKTMVRQHMDLGIIQRRLEQGSYSSASRLVFYRDILLLFSNAIVFYPKGSDEASAAHELRALVCSEIFKEMENSDSTVAPNSNPPKPKAELERSDSLLAKHKVSVPIIVCRKRSSMLTKPSTLNLGKKNEPQQQQERNGEESKTPAVEQGLLSTRSIEKPVTGTRSSRSNKNLKKVTGNSNEKHNVSPNPKASDAVKKLETQKNDKKTETAASGKKRSAANFLKRLKSSPAETVKKNSNRRNAAGGEKKDESTNKKGEKQKERVVKRNSNNKKKQAKEETDSSRKSSSTRPTKKGVEGGGASSKIDENEGSAKDARKRPRKRARR